VALVVRGGRQGICTFWPSIYDDIRHLLQTHANIPKPSDAQIQDCGLYLIDKLLAQTGKRLQQWAGPAPSAINCTQSRRLYFVLHPLGLQHFS